MSAKVPEISRETLDAYVDASSRPKK